MKLGNLFGGNIQPTSPTNDLSELVRQASFETAAMSPPTIEEMACRLLPGYKSTWHTSVLCQELDDFLSGRNPYVLFILPPRCGKSEHVSRLLPPVALGRDPREKILSVTYGDKLSISLARDVRRIMSSPEYREYFPETRFADPSERSSYANQILQFDIPGHGGTYMGTSVNGVMTGFGANIGLIDDPCKNMRDATSQQFIDQEWEMYSSTFGTRMEPLGDKPSRIAVAQTPWSVDSLIIRLKRGDDPTRNWRVVHLPALMETEEDRHHRDDFRDIGEYLWPGRYDEQTLASVKGRPRTWSALYQGRPVPVGGQMIKTSWLRRYTVPPADLTGWTMSVDAAFKDSPSGSRVAIQIFGSKGPNHYLVYAKAKHMDYPTTRQEILRTLEAFPQVTTTLIEDKANGPALIAELSNKIPGVIAIKATDGKEVRAAAALPMIEAGNLHIPLTPDWVPDYIQEMERYPQKPNDQPDATIQYLLHWSESPIRTWELFT